MLRPRLLRSSPTVLSRRAARPSRPPTSLPLFARHASTSTAGRRSTATNGSARGKILYLLVGAGIASAAVYSKTSQPSRAQRRNIIAPDTFQEFRVTQKKIASSTLLEEGGHGEHVILNVDVGVSLNEDQQGGQCGKEAMCIHTLHLASPALSIQRPYTPLYSPFVVSDDASASASASIKAPKSALRKVQLMIKKYNDGEVGRFAHSLASGDQVLLRGFDKSWQGDGTEMELILIAGGTGITPMHQLVSSLFGSNASSNSAATTTKPKITLLYSAHQISALCLLPELEDLRRRAGAERLHIELFVDQHSQSKSLYERVFGRRTKEVRGMKLNGNRVGMKDLERIAKQRNAHTHCKVLIAGPDGMVEAIAGPKARDGKSQGELGGHLSHLGWKKEQVWKL
ncbi:NADH-cytochrome b-5 reductase [Ceraceosorus bombacis]|uniref:NADH-cytochrome b-5 reductase n=1 Tax=Ceraceosorus bombacis TaxID=401625 RepID=A0A0P1BHS2_9BASI|nr:NADH-cytochrome b-5 reductase [Ceraceosorus bombacis]